MHFCGKTLVDFSVFKDAHSCTVRMMEDSLSTTSVMEDGCCRNEHLVVDKQENLKISLDKLTFEQQLFVVSLFYYSYSNSFENQEKKESLFNCYTPPPLVKNIQLLDETFII